MIKICKRSNLKNLTGAEAIIAKHIRYLLELHMQ